MYIDPHIHMNARTTDDYEAMSKAGIVAVIEPAFWLGQPRTSPDSYYDYLATLVGWEKFRASQFGIQHYCAIGLNSKEANNEALAEAVMEFLPLFLSKESVVAVGEIGFDEQTALEEKYLRAQLELAKEFQMPVMVHTPHRDKLSGCLRTMDICEEHGLPPSQVVIDHNNENTVKDVLDRGYWAGFTLYPQTKMGSERMVAVAQAYGSERIFINSSADWGVSDPLSVPKTATLMLDNGISPQDVHNICYQNALLAYGPSNHFNEIDWLSEQNIDQSELFEDNSVLRGQSPRQETLASPLKK